MTDSTPCLRPATPEEVTETLYVCTSVRWLKAVCTADHMMARIAAERLLQHLERSGIVLMKRHDHNHSITQSVPASLATRVLRIRSATARSRRRCNVQPGLCPHMRFRDAQAAKHQCSHNGRTPRANFALISHDGTRSICELPAQRGRTHKDREGAPRCRGQHCRTR
jgi:hypothetical protein